MIFQIVEPSTGRVRMTVAASTRALARTYLNGGEALFEGGPLTFDRTRLGVIDGVLSQLPYVGADLDAALQGEGAVLVESTDA